MSDQLLIREIADDDIAQVIALWNASGVARPWNDPARDIAFARRDEHSTVLVGIEGGQIVATAMAGEDGHRGWVYYVAIDPARQRSGLGRTMMQAAGSLARPARRLEGAVAGSRGQCRGRQLLRATRLSRYALDLPAEDTGGVT